VSASRIGRDPRSQRGVALIMVLWLCILLTVVGGAFAFSMRNEALASRNAVSLAQARAAADGAIDRTAFELLRPRTQQSWKPDGASHRWNDGDTLVVVSARDESSKLDLNTAAEPLLKSMFTNIGGLTDVEASAIVDAIVDWRDADDLRRPNGAEAGDYRSANSQYTPSNSAFESVGELSRVLGMTPALYARVAGSLTVHSRQSGVNPATASRETLLAFPGATPEIVDEYVTRRDEALASDLAVPPFPPAQGYAANAVPVWRIRAEAVRPDGVTFVREAVVRATADPRRPFYALLWTEGAQASAPDAPASAAASAPAPDGSSRPAAPTAKPESDARRS
jgi:general secretion pathway protein K